MGVELEVTIVTPEAAPLAVFGDAASAAVAGLLARRRDRRHHRAHVQVPDAGRVVIRPGDRSSRSTACRLPELSGPPCAACRPPSTGSSRSTRTAQVAGVERVYAAGDATDFPVKQGGLAAQQADTVAAGDRGARGRGGRPTPLRPVIHGMLLTGARPLWLAARL